MITLYCKITENNNLARRIEPYKKYITWCGIALIAVLTLTSISLACTSILTMKFYCYLVMCTSVLLWIPNILLYVGIRARLKNYAHYWVLKLFTQYYVTLLVSLTLYPISVGIEIATNFKAYTGGFW